MTSGSGMGMGGGKTGGGGGGDAVTNGGMTAGRGERPKLVASW